MNYYDKNAQEFFDDTVSADMTSHYSEFLNLLPDNACILDAGCGSGRDAKYFKELGYDITAIDASAEMCRLASELTGSDVLNIRFQEIDFTDKFDGIWASASLLHIPSDEISDVLKRLKKSLKENGVFYASFKYGDFEGERNGRYFNDLDETTSRQLFESEDFKVIKTWITHDSRKGRESERWVNILVRK